MPRVPSVLPSSGSKTSTKTAAASLVPTPAIPHASASSTVSTEWPWDAVPVASATPTTATFAPMGYEGGYDYPLIVWLHGDESDEHSLPKVMQHVSLRNFVAVAPRGVVDRSVGYGWEQSLDAIDAAEEAIGDAILAARGQFSLHPRRVFLAGVGSGGTMAMRVALRRPEWFAGVATLDGPLPTDYQPLRRINDLRELPLLLSASRESDAYAEARVCSDLALLHAAGCRVAIRQYPGDSDLTTPMLADLNRWAMEIVCG
ncbi:MAG: hypothetical protein AAF266_00925 [Planctomycetota bacterium]